MEWSVTFTLVGDSASTYVDDPGLHCTKAQVVCLMSFPDLIPVVNHPPDLER